MFKLPPFAAKFFAGFNQAPFAALEQPIVDFVAPGVMQPVQDIYRYDKTGWRTKHLPLVVGWLRSEAMNLLTGKAEDPEIMLRGSLLRADFKHCARDISERIENSTASPAQLATLMHGPLPPLWASMLHSIVKQDETWFGRPSEIGYVLHRETMRPTTDGDPGYGRFKYAGILHRDMTTEPNAAVSRLYALRTVQPMRMVANRLTDGMPNDENGNFTDAKTVKFLEQNAVTPPAGAIVLINGGHNYGTAHSSTMPTRVTPSFFAAISCTL